MLRGTKRLRGGAGYLGGYSAELYSIDDEPGACRIRRLAVGHDDAWSTERYPTLLVAERAVEQYRARQQAAGPCLVCVMNPQPGCPGYDACAARAF